MQKIFVTKYALSSGIFECEAEIEGGMATYRGEDTYKEYFHGKNWHSSLEAAVERAEEMRIKKLKSLDKQMKKISAIDFTKTPTKK